MFAIRPTLWSRLMLGICIVCTAYSYVRMSNLYDTFTLVVGSFTEPPWFTNLGLFITFMLVGLVALIVKEAYLKSNRRSLWINTLAAVALFLFPIVYYLFWSISLQDVSKRLGQ